MACRHPKRVALKLEDVGAVGLAQARRRLHQRVEHGLQIKPAAADQLENIGRRPKRRFALLDFGDVVADCQDAALRQRIEGELDIASGCSAPPIARTARIANALDARLDGLLHIDISAEVATFGHIAERVVARRPRPGDLHRPVLQLQHPLVYELDAEILVEHLDAFSHIVEHGLHDLTGLLSVGARRLGRFLRGGEQRLALLEFGDIAVDADDGAVVERLVADLDVMAARRNSLEADTARRLEMVDQLPDLGLDVVNLAKVAAADLEAAHVAHQGSGKHDIGRVALELHHALVDKVAAHIAIGRRRHQREAVIHVVDHGGEDRARALDLGGSFLHLLEQADGLNRDDRLVGKG